MYSGYSRGYGNIVVSGLEVKLHPWFAMVMGLLQGQQSCFASKGLRV